MQKALKLIKMIKLLVFEPASDRLKNRSHLSVREGPYMLLFQMPLTKASLNCQKVGFVRSLTEEGRAARRVQAKLKKQYN